LIFLTVLPLAASVFAFRVVLTLRVALTLGAGVGLMLGVRVVLALGAEVALGVGVLEVGLTLGFEEAAPMER
jgi:hypothetical protein